MSSCIQIIDYYIPSNIQKNIKLDINKNVFNKVGIKSKRISKKNQFALDLALKAVKKILIKKKYLLNKIGGVIYCSQSPEFLISTNACIIQDKLKIKNDIFAFDISQGCSGYIYGLALSSIFSIYINKPILLVTSDTYSKFLNKKNYQTNLIFGDAATASVILPSKENKIGNPVFQTDGSGAFDLFLPGYGINSFKNLKEKYAKELKEKKIFKNKIYMNGPKLFNYVINTIPDLIEKCLKKNNLLIAEIDFIIFHQANFYMIDSLRKIMKLPNSKILTYFQDIGNTTSSSIPIVIKHFLNKKKICKGNQILLVGFGVGFSSAAIPIKI